MPIPHDSPELPSSGSSSPVEQSRLHGARMRSLRKLEAARGYLDLAMPKHALRELDGIGETFRFQQDRLRGEALSALNRLDEAIAAYERALTAHPRSLPVLMGLATCHQRDRCIDRAIATLEQANLLHPLEPAVLFSLARCAALRDDVDGALTWLGRAMRLCPDVAVWAETDPDFAPLRALPDFVWFVEVAKGLRVEG